MFYKFLGRNAHQGLWVLTSIKRSQLKSVGISFLYVSILNYSFNVIFCLLLKFYRFRRPNILRVD